MNIFTQNSILPRAQRGGEFNPERLNLFWWVIFCILALNPTTVKASTPIQISGQMEIDGADVRYLVSPDGLTVVFMADRGLGGSDELFKVPITGGPIVKLNAVLPNGSHIVKNFALSPDGVYLIYQVTQGTFFDEIYRVSLSDGDAVKISSKAESGEKGFEISNDSSRVVYRDTTSFHLRDQLYSMPLSGGVAVKIATGPATDGTGGTIRNFKISPDNANVVYQSDHEISNHYELD